MMGYNILFPIENCVIEAFYKSFDVRSGACYAKRKKEKKSTIPNVKKRARDIWIWDSKLTLHLKETFDGELFCRGQYKHRHQTRRSSSNNLEAAGKQEGEREREREIGERCGGEKTAQNLLCTPSKVMSCLLQRPGVPSHWRLKVSNSNKTFSAYNGTFCSIARFCFRL